ncbi:MAG: class I SAM-dependent methyltransferase [Candidatus Asgardarchaeia archaeon]
MTTEEDYYDLTASFYDNEYGLGYSDVIFFSKVARTSGDPVLEIGCGTGRILLPIAENGFKAWGLDKSEEMLRIFQHKLQTYSHNPPDVTLVQGDVLNFRIKKKFKFIFFASNTFLHLDGVSAKYKALHTVKEHLLDNGILVIDVFNPESKDIIIDNLYRMNGYPIIHNGDRFIVYAFPKHFPENAKIIVEKTYYRISENGLDELFSTNFVINYITKSRLEEIANKAGLEVVASYGDYDFSQFSTKDSPRIILFFQKRANL